ncbi:MAG: hypothetical protein QXM68_01085 [Candidatus Aenigmatarchaeota archaeon]|nr:hypothetical protein [Candidatus Aenigmarchaeota archaeon]
MNIIVLLILASIGLSVYIAITQSIIVGIVLALNSISILFLFAARTKNEDLERIEKKIDKIDVNKIIQKMDEIRDKQTSANIKGFEVEMKLEEYKKEQEDKYRDVVKKVLEIDNKLTEKYELLGKTIIKLSKDFKKN